MNNKYAFLLLASLSLGSCTLTEQDARQLHSQAPVSPDVDGITVPRNLAPLRLAMADTCSLSSVQAVFESSSSKIIVGADAGELAISIEDWQKLVAAAECVSVRIQGKDKAGQWVEYDPLTISVSADDIDPYLSYRLIEPGYEVWDSMGLYQRELGTYTQKAIVENKQTEGGCMNCHSFRQNNADDMLFHFRAKCGGTYVIRDGRIEKLNTKTPETVSALVYPYWHPSGRFVAFSTNITKQAFHSKDPNRIEVFDNESDVVIYDTEKHEVFSCPQLKSQAAFETFPCFSADGKTLYFCSADSLNVLKEYDKVQYSLCSIGFDAEAAMSGSLASAFSATVDTIYNAKRQGGSISFPRISPDGRWLMFTRAGYGNFSIWHRDADLLIADMSNLSDASNPSDSSRPYIRELTELNSSEVDSYHSWSSNGRWVVFSTRRDDALYTRPYLTHLNDDGSFTKPFPLPQSDAHFYHRFMKSFNIPEFSVNPVSMPSSTIEQCAKTQPGIDVKYRK